MGFKSELNKRIVNMVGFGINDMADFPYYEYIEAYRDDPQSFDDPDNWYDICLEFLVDYNDMSYDLFEQVWRDSDRGMKPLL